MDKLQIPPIRTPLAEPANGSAPQTLKDWYYYWQRSGQEINSLREDLDKLQDIVGDGGGDGGGTVPPDAPPAVIGTVTVREVYDGRFEVTIPWTAGAGEPTTGVTLFVEDPDISSRNPAPLDGTIPLNGTSQVSGKWAPRRGTEDFESPAVIEVAGKPKARDIRIYVQAFGSVKNATLVRANEAGSTPNAIAHIPAASGQYVSGQEYAWLVTDASVALFEDFENRDGPKYYLTFNYTPPDSKIPLPPGLRPFGGVQIKYEYDDLPKPGQGPLLEVGHREDWKSGKYDAYAGHFKVWFCSRDVDGNVNSIVKGVTPMVEVTVVYPPEGQPSAPYITDFVLSNPRHEAQFDGTIFARADITWTNPDSPRFALVEFYRTGVTPPRKFPSASGLIHSQTLEVIDWPKTPEAWDIVAISVDYNGRPSDNPASPGASTPRVTWNIGPPGLGSTGGEYTGLGGVAGVTVTTEQELNSDGVVMMRHKISGWTNPPDASFGGMSIARVFGTDIGVYWDAAKDATTLTTDWEPAPGARTWFFYFVSRDMSGHRNSILPGVTPRVSHSFTPIAGDVVASRLPEDWWDPAEFQWPAYPGGYFQALNFIAKKIFVGSILRVGGGTGAVDPSFGGQANGQIAVYNSSNVLRAWMGEHSSGTPDNLTAHSVFGGWFTELYIGGDSPVNAPIYAKQDGTVIVGGFDVAGSRYPYISIRNNTNTEVGRIGARIGYLQAGAEQTIQGAWFREFAYGGQSFSDWRMLAKMDVTSQQGATVTMRNVDLFSIDYMQNYPDGFNPLNAAMRLEFGYTAYVSDVVGNSSYAKFPGFKVLRTGTQHGSVLVNRGLVLKNAAGNRMAALVTYNGDSFGGDTANGGVFWSELTLYSPTSGAINVQLNSGSAGSGSSFFTLRDQSGTLNFNVDQSGNVTAKAQINAATLVLSGGINCSGQITTNGQTIFCGALNAGSGNGNFGTVFCTTVNAQGSAGVNSGTFTTADGKTATVKGGVIVGLV